MRKLSLFSFLVLLLAVGCTTLKQDPIPVDTQNAGYPSAEIVVNNTIYNGVAVARIPQGNPLNSLGLKIQGYFSGKLRVTSTDCKVDVNQEYQDSALIPISIPGKAVRDCVFQVSITPVYPHQSNSEVIVSPLTGWFYLRVMAPGESFSSAVRKLSGEWRSDWQLPVAFTLPVRVIAKGCGFDQEKVISPGANNRVAIHLEDFVLLRTREVCVLRATVYSQEYSTPLELGALIAQYDKSFNPLGNPALSYKNGKIRVVGQEGVAIVSLGSTALYTNDGSFDFVPNKMNVLRLYTVKGRILIGEWSVASQEWTWKR